CRRVLAAVQGRQGLPRQRQQRRLVPQLHDVAIGLDHLVGVGRSQHHQPRLGAERRKLLYRLMSGSVLAVSHGIVRKHKDGGQLHQGREPNGRPRIITEDEEGGAEGAKFRQRESVDRGRHRMLADAEMQVSATGGARLEVSRARKRERSLGGRTEVRRSAEQPGYVLSKYVEDLARGIAAGDALRVGGKNRQLLIPSLRQL